MTSTRAFPSSVLGVLDIIDGQACDAVAGNRQRYKKLNGSPVQWLHAFADLGINGVYIADLDAIEPASQCKATLLDLNPALNWRSDLIQAANELGLQLWVDAGNHIDRWVELYCSHFGNHAQTKAAADNTLVPILAAESFQTIDRVNHFCSSKKLCGLPPAIGLDWKAGQFMGLEPKRWMNWAVESQVNAVVLLELDAIGRGQGPKLGSRCSDLRQQGYQNTIVTGGGVRHESDIQRLIDLGADFVLVGRWLREQITDSRLAKFSKPIS